MDERETSERDHMRNHNFRRRSDIEKTGVISPTGEAELRTAIDETGVGIFDYYPLSGELNWSPAAKTHFGLSADAYVNYNVFLVGLHPRDRDRVDHMLHRALLGDNDGKYEAEYRTIGIEDGEERWIQASGRAFFNARGEAVRFVGTTLDITGRKRVEQELHESAEQYRLLFDRSPLPKWVIDPETFALLDVNDAAIEFYGYSREEFKNISLADIRIQEEFALFRNRVKDAASSGNRFEGHMPTKHRRKNSEIAEVDVHYTEIRYNRRKALIGVIFDLTELRRADAAFRTSQRLVEAIIENAPVCIKLVDRHRNLLMMNRAGLRIIGADTLDSVKGKNFSEFVLPEHRPSFENLEQKIFQGESGTLEFEMAGVDGRRLCLDTRAVPLYDDKGKVFAMLGITLDITEQKRAADKIAHLASIPEMNPDPIAELDLQGNITYVNPALARQFPDLREKGKAHPLLSQWPRIESGLKAGNQSVVLNEVEADGRTFHQTVYYAREKNLIRIFHADITQRKQAELERERLIAELQRSNKELQQFAYAVSHDLQEPLRTVSSYVDLLSVKYKEKLDEKADKYISFAVEGAARMHELITDLLAFSRVGTQGGPFARVEMDQVVDRAIGNLRKSIKESAAAVTRDNMPEVFGDEIQLGQLLQNLVGNAVKFRKQGVEPQIHISSARRGNEWVFGVRDNGIGIDPRFYERIFTIFQRLHAKEEYRGTGVGLAISKRIVERHGGKIWVESKPGEGSSFYFTLPAKG